ncbi:MAG TPA: hypothetical protein VMU47_10195 [Caldimonas sp.]|nr:hypothetical protein [Caldimonas sp.]
MSQVPAAGHLHRHTATRPDYLPAAEQRAFRRSYPVDGELAVSSDEFGNPFEVRLAHDPGHCSRASSLLQRRYAWRGYAAAPIERHARQVTLAAFADDTTVATITAALDREDGLFVSRLYPGEVQSLRDEGRRLCEFTKLAVDESVRSHTVLGAIFHVACLYAINLHRCTDALIEVNPRHVRFYERMLGFERFGEQRLDPAVGAPAVLLRLDLAHCAREIERLGGRRRSAEGERSFYPYFFGPDAARQILARLRGH